ncbi:DNA helicase HerA-like ATPase [Thermocatellispora tengchongensis]|uniref:DNA helicase HerA-like ATPase n=1 Tax=Thermocatellispora tengchongensis TaxID=1073253 RepID=A0A840PBP0_9ACTN|nr:ATP-binding protein [Thermocatellispora tengchongensis]MBB5138824.1 DNA helicase HerA-like ATPase [Thermocatellispora tengchongensis]
MSSPVTSRAVSALGGGPLSGPWYRVQAITAPSRTSSAEWDFVTILPAVLSAAQRDRAFVIGWLSRGSGTPLELITNAGPLTPPRPPRRAADAGAAGAQPAGPQPLLFPGGARGVPIGDEWLHDLADLVWTPCPGRQAPPLGGRREPDPDEIKRPTLFESTLVTLMSRPFAWLVVAEPTDLLDAEVAHLRTQLNVLRQYGDASERSRFDAERAERRMQELDAFREAGLWNVRVLAGAAGPEELRQIAPVLVGSVEMSHHPYRLRSALPARSGGEAGYAFADALGVSVQDPTDGAAAPFAATAGALAALAGLPRREVPGVRVLDAGFFDVTSEADGRTPEGDSIDLGAIVDAQDRTVGSFRVPLATLNRHAFVTGATGSGKSQTVRHMLEQLTASGIPWLAIEPAKSEYAAMAGRIEHLAPLTVINPSAPDNVPFSVNPLAPEPGYPVQAHIDMVRALFMAAFDAEEPFPQIMSLALQRVYEANGWDVVTGGGIPGAAVRPAVPTLEQLQAHAMAVIHEIGYGREVQADVEGFIRLRLRSLRVGSAGRFFEGGHPADIGDLLRRNVVLAIEDVANDEDKAFLMGTLIIRIVEHLRMRARQERSAGLQHVIVIEEAHRLLRDRGEGRASTHAVELLAGMLAEIRAYGEGIVVAEQIPTKLVSDVVKNTALKVVHRLPAEDDRRLVGAAMNLSEEQSRQVVSLQPGTAAVFADGMDRPLRVSVPLGEDRERPMLGPVPPICGRRSAACGPECRTGKACTLVELREADLLADAPEWAWLRIWTDTLVLAFCTNRPLPGVPRVLADAWAELPVRRRECLLATLVERAVARRAWSLRTLFDPDLLTEKAAATALRLLTPGEGVREQGERQGPSWVIPQIRWLHEVDRLFPYGHPAPDLRSPAPPMEYRLLDPDPGAVRPPRPAESESNGAGGGNGGNGVNGGNGGNGGNGHRGDDDGRVELLGHRAKALRHHPLSMEVDRNRALAWRALLGDDEHEMVDRDIMLVAVGVDPRDRLRHVAYTMAAGWLEAVLSWPGRFVFPFDAESDEDTEISFAEAERQQAG